MEVDKIKLSPAEQVEHIQNHKCFICHKVGCHFSKHAGYPRGGTPQRNPPSPGHFQKTNKVVIDPRVTTYMNKKGITPEQALSLLGTAFGDDEEGA